jgi:signal transduction histidine kinase/CheY-like chemotaxis protein
MNAPLDPPRSQATTLVLAVAGLYAVAAGLASFLGWAFDVPRLADWDDDGIAMQPNTTIAAMAVGAALVQLARGRARGIAVLGLLIGLIGAASLFQYLSGVSLGIDTLLMFGRTWGRVGTLTPGRMGPPASVAWTAAGTALLLLQTGTRVRPAVSVLGLVITGISALSIIGYVFGADLLYSMPRLTAIAFQTSTILLAVGLGLLAAVPERQPVRGLLEDSAAGVLTRRVLPFIIVIPVVLGLVRLAGQRFGLYDAEMGTGIMALSLIGFFCVVLWWTAAAVRGHELAARELNARLQTSVTAERRAAAEREELLAIAQRARAEAEKADRAKDEFLAVLSHELRSPLNAMLGWVRILRQAGSGDPMVSRAVETLERNIWAQSRVVNDLLDISRITSGQLQLERSRVDIAVVITDAVESMLPMATGKRLQLELSIPDGRLDVAGDAARLHQVIANVLQNAVKFTPEGGRIAVRLRHHDGRAEIEVEDNGQGIDAALLPHVFDRFVQSESSTTRRHGGLGLGLAIVKHLIALHGGTVRAESDGGGRGTRFTITLPLASPLERDAGVPAIPGRADRVQLARLEVLLVDDDLDSREALGIAITQSGAQVRLAASVHEALEAYDARPPDVLVSDIAMPGEDGYALIRAVRQREDGARRRTLAIAMTGFASRQDHEAALRAGFDEHVGKPVEPTVLLERINVLVAARVARPGAS